MENSKIEWTHHTFNPWIGCTKVSPGCLNCYAETLMDKRHGRVKWGKGQPRSRTGPDNWRKPRQWNKAADGAAERPRVFCASLADWLDDEVPIEWLADLLTLIRDTPHLDWLLLTKRPENWRGRLKEVRSHSLKSSNFELHGFIHNWLDRFDLLPPPNVWVGTSVEDQQRADERIPELLKIPARVRFLSCEPLLGAVEFSNVTKRSDWRQVIGKPALEGIHWVIAGGESGPGARPMAPEWARSLRDQCVAAGVAFHFKQWGGVNKKAAGRELDGRTWDELPVVTVTETGTTLEVS